MAQSVRYSKKREAILQTIRGTTCHPTAEWIYQELKSEVPDLSLGTVYRNLQFLKDQGLIQSVGVVDGQERFDGTTTAHAHFVCSRCSAVIDLHDVPIDAELNQAVCLRYQVEVARQEMVFYGVCAECRATEEE